MATFAATGTGLILPDGDEIAPDATGVELSEDALGNAGVKAWIESGLLIDEAKAKAEAKKAKEADKDKSDK